MGRNRGPEKLITCPRTQRRSRHSTAKHREPSDRPARSRGLAFHGWNREKEMLPLASCITGGSTPVYLMHQPRICFSHCSGRAVSSRLGRRPGRGGKFCRCLVGHTGCGHSVACLGPADCCLKCPLPPPVLEGRHTWDLDSHPHGITWDFIVIR